MPFIKHLLALCLALWGLSAASGLSLAASPEATAALDRAKAAHVAGDDKSALEAIWVAQEAIWNDVPLGVRNVAFVVEQPENFGSYVPKEGADFQSHEPLILYSEPYGFTQQKEPDGTYAYSIYGAFAILDADERLIANQDKLGPYEMSGYRTFSVENMLAMTIGVQGLPAGSYVLRLTLTDNIRPEKTVSVDKPFRLVGE
ncbi:MAG: hypothetical protein LBE01_03245 [Deltaproteobacteria bacterium]|jgi:hypothetical protein|nr:hypothetical protein [Deltaproteobacteria bacterium]